MPSAVYERPRSRSRSGRGSGIVYCGDPSSVVMRLLVLLGLLVTLTTAPAEAQSPAITDGQEAALYGLPVLATAGATYLALRLDEDQDTWVPFLVLPLISRGAACGAGLLTDATGSCRGAMLWGALGALPGYLAVGAGFALGEGDVIAGEDALGLVILGAVSAIAVPPFAAAAGYRHRVSAAPAVVSDPSSHRVVPGMQLRFGL
jgi:hypothetical protein